MAVFEAPASGIGRQAVVIIHGIGEQRPMNTLRAFAGGALGLERGQDRFFSKPDRISDTLELRRLAAFPPDVPIQTDFYELYWAHLMEGTTWRHVAAWFQMLLWRSPAEVPRRLRTVWWFAWIALVSVAGAYLLWRPDAARLLATGALTVAAAAAARWLAGSFGLGVVGDAARYLSPTPANIRVRHAIRSAALSLLRGLHADTRYERIILVGHSLGSVVAYDALTYLWQESHSVHGSPEDSRQPRYEEMQARLAATGAGPVQDFRALQRALWDEQRGAGIPWRITDLVTLGSPLAHAPFLLASSQDDFDERVRQRELPTCPPQPDDRRDIGFLSKEYATPSGKRSIRILHHAALFACTRWTNIYFAADLVGGRVGPHFGGGVWDVEVQPATRASRSAMAHTRYWHPGENYALATLACALDLGDVAARERVETAGAIR